jgi:hypothetical protein
VVESALTRLASIPADKVLHFAMGAVLFALLLHLAGPGYSLAAVAACGVAKELYDLAMRHKHTPDVWDAAATILGGATAFTCTF